MKKYVVIILTIILLGFAWFYFNREKEIDYKSKLNGILSNETRFIDEDNNSLLFNEYKITDKNVEAVEYAFVDLDKDGMDELVVLTSSDYGAYLVFHYEDNKIYGYMIGVRSFENLKTDGTFIGSEGATNTKYLTISFDKNKYEMHTNAVKNEDEKIYKIEDKDVSKEDIDKYISTFMNKDNVIYKSVK